MTIDEFKAWLEGFEHSFTENGPDKDQWAEIKKKIEELEPVKTNNRTNEPSFPGTPFRWNQELKGATLDCYSDNWVKSQ